MEPVMKSLAVVFGLTAVLVVGCLYVAKSIHGEVGTHCSNCPAVTSKSVAVTH